MFDSHCHPIVIVKSTIMKILDQRVLLKRYINTVCVFIEVTLVENKMESGKKQKLGILKSTITLPPSPGTPRLKEKRKSIN